VLRPRRRPEHTLQPRTSIGQRELSFLSTKHSDENTSAFVDGSFARSESDASVEVTNPSDGKHCISIPAGCDADVDLAVSSAHRAFEDGRWSEAAPSFRNKALQRLAGLIEANAPQLDVLDASEMGKPISEAVCNAAAAAGLVRFYAEASDKVLGDVCTSDKHSIVLQRPVPRGVVAAIVPWNFPTYVAALKFAPALAAGNSVVLKPSEFSSRSALRIAQLAIEAGIPPGILNVVPGLGQIVGRALGLHHDVDMVTFTGSGAVGKLLLQYAGQSNLKVVKAECGGKSPQIVFADGVDLDAASQAVARGLLINQGQICSAGSRLVVQRSIQKTVVQKIVERFAQVAMGHALNPKTTFGPVATANQCARVMSYIDAARDDGADLVVGGHRVLGESGGFFIEPTVFCNVAPSARIAQEEIFGPVLAVIPFDDEEHAIRIANGTDYGLMAYVWTASLSTGMKVAKAIRSPVIVNAAAPQGEGAEYGFSFEPARQSGVGAEGGLPGLDGYFRRQMIQFNHG
jgi:acyl-CoA reductase-like NAD-dependent aldehyde dehydrogenase